MFTQYLKLAFTFIFIFLTHSSRAASPNDYIFDPKDAAHTLYVPEGKGPFPAILLLHASTGVVKVNHEWAAMLKNHGYVVYIIDSFKPRGWTDRESVGWEKATGAQLSDIAPAYRYLSHLPNVKANRIGILGFSMGGFDVLRVMEKPNYNLQDYQNIPFQVAVSFYGVCHRLAAEAKLRGPTMVFIGDNDDRATTQDCKELIKRSYLHNESTFIKIYKNALHGFDNFEFPPSKEVVDEKGEHYHVGYNHQASQLAINDLPKFLDRYLK
ncbi:MAG: dienelactone hydrolase family protein [Gammaproteobacteria bacterium]|nr:dienelactone hydrolase family protein [Gammaproteobacteria bacterium]